MSMRCKQQEGFFSGAPAHTPRVVAGEHALVPEGLLAGDEIVLLAVKPSLWFIVLRSAPWLAGCALAGLAVWYLAAQHDGEQWSRLALQGVIAAALISVSVAMFQWTSRLYVLTNRRVMRIKGALRVDIFESPLHRIQSTCLMISPTERLLRIGTIRLTTAGEHGRSARWEHIAQPATIHTRLRNAIARSHMSGGGQGQ